MTDGEVKRKWEFVPTQEGSEPSAEEWRDATPAERGKALEQLLLLEDALPSGQRRGKPLRCPRLDSAKFN
jgi:hypothetical protein